MSFFVITKNTRRHVPFLFIIVLFTLIIFIIFHTQYIQLNPYAPVFIEQNNILNGKHSVRIHQPFSLSMLRGILIFYPHDQEAHFLPELLWFYRSWIEMMKDEPSLWRTDLIIYTGNYSSNLQQLGCIYNDIRINRQEPPQCRVFLYKCLRLRDIQNKNNTDNYTYQQFDRNRSTLLTTHLKTYEYLDSINVIAEYYPSFSMYDYILRTDIDVFLTKYFGRFVPYNDTLLVGRGGYSTTFNNARLRRIAKDMNWLYANLTNIGSTWYGPPQVAQRIANFSLEAILYLSINEFSTPEREKQLGTLLWPDWHYGVLLLYGCHLAFNHLVLNESINLSLAYDLLDQSSTNKDQYDLEKNTRLHIHCWHELIPFSKFLFKAGNYNNLSLSTFVHDASAVGYAMRMALESRLMSFSDLKQRLINAKNSSRF